MYQTKTGIELTVINGLGQGDGVPMGQLSLVKALVKKQVVRKTKVSVKKQKSWIQWVKDTSVS